MNAFMMASIAHDRQYRKYTGEPYICHPYDIAQESFILFHSNIMYDICLLHDIIEDSNIFTFEDIHLHIGEYEMEAVRALTNTKAGRNRGESNLIYCQQLEAAQNFLTHTVKVLDRKYNCISIKKHEPKYFHTVYKKETKELIKYLNCADKCLLEELKEVCDD